MLWQILFSLIVLRALYVYYKKRGFVQLSRRFKNNYIALPVFGHTYLFVGNDEDRMRALQLLGRQAINNGGIASMWLGGHFVIIMADPVELEIVMKASLEKDDGMRFARLLTGNGTIFASVPIWRPRRKILAPTFSPKNLNPFMEIFTRQSSVMVDQLQKHAGNGPFPIWRYVTTYTMDSICDSTLGVKLNAQLQPDQPFLKAFEKVCQLASLRMLQPWLHSDLLYSMLPSYTEFQKGKKVICDFIQKVIVTKQKNMQKLEYVNSKSPEETRSEFKTFLELLIESSKRSRGYSDEELLEETMVIVLAGTDTSAVGASFALVMLSKHPHVQEKVYQELQDVLGDSNTALAAEDLHRLKYLDAVIKETLRLYPPVPIITRKIQNDVELSSGVTLTKGCGILIHIWATHRNPGYWGDDAEFFRPERFLDSPPQHPAAFQAFSYGPRSCIGYQYAMMSMKTSVSAVVQRYRIHPDARTNIAPDTPLRVTFEVMMKDVNRFTVQLEKRSE